MATTQLLVDAIKSNSPGQTRDLFQGLHPADPAQNSSQTAIKNAPVLVWGMFSGGIRVRSDVY